MSIPIWPSSNQFLSYITVHLSQLALTSHEDWRLQLELNYLIILAHEKVSGLFTFRAWCSCFRDECVLSTSITDPSCIQRLQFASSVSHNSLSICSQNIVDCSCGVRRETASTFTICWLTVMEGLNNECWDVSISAALARLCGIFFFDMVANVLRIAFTRSCTEFRTL